MYTWLCQIGKNAWLKECRRNKKFTEQSLQDLLPLYEDGLCSEVSRKSIEEHLEECQSCRELLENIRDFKEPELLEATVCKEDEVVAKSFRKVRRRWKTSLVAILLVVPTLLLSINQIRGEGMCFTNMDDIWVVGRYVHALEQGNFEKAASYMDYAYSYRDVQRKMHMTVADMSLGEFTEFMQEYYTNQLQECADLGHSFKNKGFASDYTYYTDGNGHWHIGYEMEITYGGEVYPVYICFSVENWKIINIVSMHWPEKHFEETDDKTDALRLDYPD